MAQQNEAKLIAKLCIGFLLVIFVLCLFFGTFYTVDAGDRALLLTLGSLSPDVQGPGLHFKIPLIQKAVIMSVRTQTITFDNRQATGTDSEYSSLAAMSSDQQDVALATIVNYHLEDKDLLNIYRQYGDMPNYQQNILEPVIRDTVKTTAAQYTAIELNSKRTEYESKISELLLQRFADKSADFDRVSTTNVEYTAAFADSIEKKVISQQNVLTQQNNLEAAKYQAEAIKVQSEAIQNQGGASYIELQAIQKWNGVMPVVVGGATPFVSLGQITNTSN